jgi:hypothetical protein
MQMTNISFFFVAVQNSIAYKYNILLIHSSIMGHLGCFHRLPILNSATIQMGMLVPL